jgi:zinc protease
MNEVFGGYFLSRLNLNLREKRGLTYSIHSSFSFRLRTGPFCISAAIQADKCLEAIKEIIAELEKIISEEVSDDELQSAAGYISGIFPVAFETADQIALGLANIVSFDLPDNYYRTFRDHILEVDAQDIRRAAVKRIFPRSCQIVVTGDRTVLEEPLKEHFPLTVFDVLGNQI